jgi:type II secretory pathway component PulJ
VNRVAGLRKRFAKDEMGFTLTEITVTIMIMMVVLLALYGISDMSLKAYSFGNSKVEATGSARAGMEKMEREIRQAYNYDLTSDPKKTYLLLDPVDPTTALTVPPTDVAQLTFGNDLPGAPGAGNGKIECGSPCEYITYKLTDDASNTACGAAPCTLRRVNTASPADWGEPVVENVALNGLSFTLLRSDGTVPACENQVGMVLVKLTVSVDRGISNPGTQELTTVVDLRNRGFVDNATACS